MRTEHMLMHSRASGRLGHAHNANEAHIRLIPACVDWHTTSHQGLHLAIQAGTFPCPPWGCDLPLVRHSREVVPLDSIQLNIRVGNKVCVSRSNLNGCAAQARIQCQHRHGQIIWSNSATLLQPYSMVEHVTWLHKVPGSIPGLDSA